MQFVYKAGKHEPGLSCDKPIYEILIELHRSKIPGVAIKWNVMIQKGDTHPFSFTRISKDPYGQNKARHELKEQRF